MSDPDRLTELRDILAEATRDRESAGQRWKEAQEAKANAESALEAAEYALDDARADLSEAEDDLDAADTALAEVQDAVAFCESEEIPLPVPTREPSPVVPASGVLPCPVASPTVSTITAEEEV